MKKRMFQIVRNSGTDPTVLEGQYSWPVAWRKQSRLNDKERKRFERGECKYDDMLLFTLTEV